MVFCLFCSRKYKTKKAYKSHAESQSHKEKEKEVKKDLKKYRQLFLTNISTFISRYDDYKDIEFVYKAYIKDNIIGWRDVGYKDIPSMAKDLKETVDVIQKDNKFFVKGFTRFVPKNKIAIENESSSDELSTEEKSDYEEFSGDQETLLCFLKD